jgi:hypothetical protein
LSWKRRFDDPIVLPDGRKLVTLLDAATYATKLPKKEADSPEWQAAIESLMLVAALEGPTMFARIGVMRVLNRHVNVIFGHRPMTSGFPQTATSARRPDHVSFTLPDR